VKEYIDMSCNKMEH